MPFWQTTAKLKKRAEFLASQSFVVLSMHVPKSNDKSAQSFEQFFSAIHGIYKADPVVQEHLSFEIVAKEDSIMFYVFVPLHLREFIEGQLYAQYPNLEIKQVKDYTAETQLEGLHVATTRIQLTREDVYPIKTYSSLDIDPLAGITAVMDTLSNKDQIWLQIVVKPVGDEWQNRGVSHVKDIRAGKKPGAKKPHPLTNAAGFSVNLIKEIASPGSGFAEAAKAEPPKLSSPEEAALKGIESKITKLGFEAIFRLVIIAADEASARSRTQSMLGALKQFNTTNLNGFKSGETKIDHFPSWQQYLSREAEEKGSVLNIEELASVYHFPTGSVESSAISWAGAKKADAPLNIPLKEEVDPKELTVLGKTDYRSHVEEFGVKLGDRKRHIYIIGKSGVGKSTLLENMIIDDINEGRGVIVVDPHGELADKVVESVPENRIKDVIYFDPSDRQFPVAFNVLDITHPDQKGNIASGFVGALKKIFGNSWGPRLEYILRNATLALLDTENPTMLGIPRILTDASFRNWVIPQIKDPVVLDFWKNEWANKEQKQQVEEMGSILNKVGQFLSTSLIRNIVGQPKSAFDIRKVMDEKKILLVNLSKGKIGEDNSALLGTMIITRVQLAAMSRADTAPDQRPDCFLYVDEFQNFATDSFATILSEARKYNLGLTIAHQYIEQMEESVREAVFGNVGSIICFRVGSKDAETLAREFAPVFGPDDMVNLQMARVYIKLLVDGVASQAFSAMTLPPKKIPTNYRDRIIEFTHDRYAKPRDVVEDLIDETAGYKRRREAEEAAKAAAAVLAQAPRQNEQKPNVAAQRPQSPIQDRAFNSVTTASVVQQVTKPVEPAKAQLPEPVRTQERSLQANLAPVVSNENSEEGRERKPIKEKPLRVINGWAYKEVSQKGGNKWHIGEKESEVLERRAAKSAALSAARLERSESADSPRIPSTSEHKANVQHRLDEPIEFKLPQSEHETSGGGSVESGEITLREGQQINL
jgi:Type IV secretion-system coupling protein DNA-binding domain